MNDLVKQKQKNIINMLEKMKGEIARAVPKHLTADKIARLATTELRSTPKLLECNETSLLKCVLASSQLGLELGPLGHVYFVPHNKECTLIIGYKGMLELAYRGGKVSKIEARIIHEFDDYEIHFGNCSNIYHSADLSKDRGRPIAAYAVATMANEEKHFEVLTFAEIEKIRKGKNGPWVTDWNEMAKKTAVRRLFKYLPCSTEMQKAITIDEANEYDKQGEIINNAFDYSVSYDYPEMQVDEQLVEELTT